MAALTGLMVGSLRKIWPFRTTDGVTEFNVLPEQVDATVLITIACFVVGMALVFGLNHIARDRVEA